MDLTTSVWAHVDERAQDFTGREWVFERIRSFLASEARMLVIVAPPGTGKTAIAARLAQASAGHLADVQALSVPAGTIDAAVFCQVGLVSLLEVAQDLAGQLSETLPGFADEQRSTVATSVAVSGVQVETGHVDAGASVTGVRIDLARLGPADAFADGVALPLKRLAEKPGFRRPVLLVDSLDEAFASPVAQSLPRSLAALIGARLIVTSRDDPRVLSQLDGLDAEVARGQAALIHLVDDAPRDIDDVADYVLAQLHEQGPDEAIAVLARRIGEAAVGNFLYAYFVVRGLGSSGTLGDLTADAALGLALPADGLAGVYRDFLARELGANEERWSSQVRPILAPLAVALGDGLDTTQLAAIGSVLAGGSLTISRARDVTRMAGQFLRGSKPDGPFGVYHRSFAEFLLDARENPDWPVDAKETNGAIVDALMPRDAAGVVEWGAVSRYGLEYLAAHLREFDPEGLVHLLTTYQYLESKLAALKLGAVLQDFELAAPVLVGSDTGRTIDLLRGALRLAGQALLRNPTELPTQLIGRLGGLPDELLRRLVTSAKSSRLAPWLEPLRPSLAAPGGPFRVSFRGHAGTPRSVAITADGRIGASAGNSSPDQTVRIWDLDAGKELPVLSEQAEAGGYTPIALSGDGRLLMTAYDREVRLWDTTNGVPAATFREHGSRVQAVAIATLTSVAVTGDADGVVLLWDLERRQLTRRLRSGPGAVQAIALTPDGRSLAVLGDATVELWDVAGARLAKHRSIEGSVGRGRSVSIAIAQDASSIVYGDPVQFWTVGTNEVRPVGGQRGQPLAIAIEGERILTATLDGRGCEVMKFDGHSLMLPDRDALASAGALSRDGRWALTAYFDHKLLAWDLASPAAGDAGQLSAPQVDQVAITLDGRRAIVFGQPVSSVWDLDTGEDVSESAPGIEAIMGIRAQLAIDGALIDALEDDRSAADARVGDHPGNDGPRRMQPGQVVVIRPDLYRHLWCLGADDHLALHWLQPMAKTSEAEEDPNLDGDRRKYPVDVVDADKRALVVRLDGHSTHIVDGAISADGRRAATASIGWLVRVWDLPSGTLRATLPAHRDPVSAVDLSSDGTLIASASWDGSVRVWDIEDGREVATFSGDSPMLACAISADGSRVVAGDRAGRVHLLRLRGGRNSIE